VAVAGQPGRDRPADGTAAKHQVSHGAQRYNTIKPSVQVSTSIYKS
jgi:hypothetical protein